MKAFGIVFATLTAIVLVILGITGIYFITTYNGLVAKQEALSKSWGQVEVVCQRRADLIPNLVATVKGYAAHEKGVFENVAEARAKAGSIRLDAGEMANNPEQLQKFLAAQKELSGALTKLLAVSENYPTLKADQGFLTLQGQIEGSENRIAVERGNAQKATNEYNVLVKGFFSSMVAGSKFQPVKYFEADAGAKVAPKVNF
ncbi:MAG: LemA family protein [bacterium]